MGFTILKGTFIPSRDGIHYPPEEIKRRPIALCVPDDRFNVIVDRFFAIIRR
jgi:hypothetical protein